MLENSPKHGALASPVPPPDAGDDWVVPQYWDEFTAEDHWVWDTLFARQKVLLRDRAVSAFGEGLGLLEMERSGIPNFDELNEKLERRTGWKVVAVPGLVPDEVFFEHLSNRRFPAANFIRAAHQLDYLEEPDLFHDVFGHVPLLAQPAIADFLQAMGTLGLQAIDLGALHRIARLYWYTIEFGLVREADDLKIYGAGILSSFGESHYAIESGRPHRLDFDLRRAMRTAYRPDALQLSYFVVDRLEDVLELVEDNDFEAICAELQPLPDLNPAANPSGERLVA